MLEKPVNRDEHIRELSREHHFSLLFCWKIRQGLKPDVTIERIRKCVQYFWQHHLQPHFREKENILFALIKDRPVQRAINEHKHLKQQIGGLSHYSENNERKSLAKIADMVDKHVRYVERAVPAFRTKIKQRTIGKHRQVDSEASAIAIAGSV